MELEIVPDPTPEEREAILAALAQDDGEARPADGRRAWLRAGLETEEP